MNYALPTHAHTTALHKEHILAGMAKKKKERKKQSNTQVKQHTSPC